jgi:hypothetical protein
MARRHRDSLLNEDTVWLQELAGQDASTVAARWTAVTPAWPGWKLVALARRMVALGVPVTLSVRLVRTLEARRHHRASASQWAALPNLQRLATMTPSGSEMVAHSSG